MWYAVRRAADPAAMVDYLYENQEFRFWSYQMEDYLEDCGDSPLHMAAREDSLGAFVALFENMLRARGAGDSEWSDEARDMVNCVNGEGYSVLDEMSRGPSVRAYILRMFKLVEIKREE